MISIIFALILGGSEGVEVPLDSNMNMSYTLDGNEIEITLTCSYGWCGIGFGSGMLDGDMIAVLYPNGGSVSLLDTYSSSLNQPPSDVSLGGANNLSLVSSSGGASTFTVTFRRNLAANESQDKSIVVDQSQVFMYAYAIGASSYSRHDVFSKGTIVISEDNASVETSDNRDEQGRHGSAMIMAWNYLIPISVAFARYFKWWAFWYWIHMLLATAAIFITVGSAVYIMNIEENAYASFESEVRRHSRFGFAIAAMVLGQGLMGLMIRLFQRFSILVNRLLLIRRLHKILGWALFAVSVYNVFLGYQILDDIDDFAPPIVICAIFFLFEVRHQITPFLPFLNLRIFKMKNMTHEEAFAEISDGKKLVFCDEYVLLVKEFMYSHPGGAFLIKKAIGEDMGKYLVGCSSFGGNLLPYTHSRQALDMLEHLAIAKISPPINFFEGAIDYIRKDKVKIIKKAKVAESTYLLELESDTVKVNDKCMDLRLMGKHFKVNLENNGVTRYYSSFFCDYQNWNSSDQRNGEKKTEGSIQLMIKMYKEGEMTGRLDKMNEGDHVILSGPYGPGLALNTISGNFLAVVAGTGLVPMFDLINYMYEKRDGLDLTLSLYISFSSRKFALAEEPINRIAQQLGNKLKVVWYFSDEKNGKPAEMIEGLKNPTPDLVWLCGPSGFNRFAYNLMKKEPKIPKKKIILM